MKNCFKGIGSLSECRIDLYESFIKMRFSLRVNNQIITFHYRKSKKFQKKEYEQIIKFIPYLHPEIDGNIYLNGTNKYYVLTNKKKCKLFVSGNVFANKIDIYFNVEFLTLENVNSKDFFDIEIDGVFINNNKFLNVVNNTPIVLNIPSKHKLNNYYYRLKLSYPCNYIQKENIIKPLLNKEEFTVESMYKLKQNLSNKLIKNYLLEWEIMNNAEG